MNLFMSREARRQKAEKYAKAIGRGGKTVLLVIKRGTASGIEIERLADAMVDHGFLPLMIRVNRVGDVPVEILDLSSLSEVDYRSIVNTVNEFTENSRHPWNRLLKCLTGQ